MDPRCRIEMLGGLRVTQGDRVITRFSTQKTAALLAYLAFHSQKIHPRELLIDLLWPDSTLPAGRNSLSVALSSLRRQLEPPGVESGAILRTDTATVRLNPTAVTTDLSEFETALQRAERAGSDNQRAQLLSEAVALYQGDLLPGFYEEWILTEQQRLAELAYQALLELARCREGMGDLSLALGCARRAVRLDPLREEAHRQAIRLLIALDQPSAAMREYAELERLLDQELGEAPSEQTRRLACEIRSLERRGSVGSAPVPGRMESQRRSAAVDPPPAPTGTVTFLLTEVLADGLTEGLTDGLTEDELLLGPRGGPPAARPAFLERYQTLLRQLAGRTGGQVTNASDRALTMAFTRPSDALEYAVAGQRMLAEQSDAAGRGATKVRMALHLGEVKPKDTAEPAGAVEFARRLLVAAQAGQILCSEDAARLLQRGLEPGLQLKELGLYRLSRQDGPERLFAIEFPGMARTAAPNAPPACSSNLPAALDAFVGRGKELAWLEETILRAGARLVTLTGPGGTGKTRLALEAARRLQQPLQGAVWFIPLAGMADPSLIPAAIRLALDLPPAAAGDPVGPVRRNLSRQPSLLLFDNFEHLLQGGAPIVQELLERVESLRCLVTSRQPLDLPGEREYLVPPLPVPESTQDCPDTPERLSQCESVRLFVNRAQAVDSDFQLTKSNGPAVAELCRRLEGIPLAIELAASRARMVTPAQMLAEMEHRFDFLICKKKVESRRHQTLRAAIDWSYDLLPAELQRFFARLSVFRDGWTADSAEAVCKPERRRSTRPRTGMAQRYLAQLTECSLTIPDPAAGAVPRFHMLETLREYADEKLTAEERRGAQRRHLGHFLSLAAGYSDSNLPAWLDQMQSERRNLRAALAWCETEQGNPAQNAGLILTRRLSGFWYHCGHFAEGRRRRLHFLARTDPARRSALRAGALHSAALLAQYQSDNDSAEALFEQAAAVIRPEGDPELLGASLTGLGVVASYRGDFARARSLYEESLALYQEASFWPGVAWVYASLGWLAAQQGEPAIARKQYEESLALRVEQGNTVEAGSVLMALGMLDAETDPATARARYEQSLEIKRTAGDRPGIACGLHLLGDLSLSQGDRAAAAVYYAESLAIGRDIGSQLWEAVNLHDQGVMAAADGEPARALSLYRQSLALEQAAGDRPAIAQTLESVAGLAPQEIPLETAAGFLGTAAALREEMGVPCAANRREDYERCLQTVKAGLGQEAFAAAWALGRSMTPDGAVARALGRRSTH